MSEYRRLPPGAVFEFEGRWYLRVGEKGVQAMSKETAMRRRSSTQRPRTLPEDRPTDVNESSYKSSAYLQTCANTARYSYRNRYDSDQRADDKRDTTLKSSWDNAESFPRQRSQRKVIAGSDSKNEAVESRHTSAPKEMIDTAEGLEPVMRGRAVVGVRNQTNSESSVALRYPSESNSSSLTDTKSKNPAEPMFSVLSGLPTFFCSIPEDDYSRRAEFLATYPELLKTNLNNLYLEATQQMRNDIYETARQCISSLVIIRQCENLKNKPELIEGRVSALNDPRTERAKSYREMFAAVEESIRTLVKKPDQLVKTKAVDSFRDDTVTYSSRRSEIKPDMPSGRSTGNPIKDIERLTVDSRTLSPEDLLNDIGEGLSDILSAVAVKTRDNIQMAPTDFAEGDLRTLSSKYRVYEKASTFFIPGRVFSMLWHDPAGRTSKRKGTIDELTEPHDGYLNGRLARNTTIGPYGEKIYSHIRRMIVIRSRAGYCWAISLGTYGGCGLKKRGLKRSDIDSHAIVYDSRLKPQYLPNEPETSKMPIAVKLKPGQTLSESSRLHYGKPITVEFNQPVMDCGMVLAEHLPILLSEVRSEMLDGLPQA